MSPTWRSKYKMRSFAIYLLQPWASSQIQNKRLRAPFPTVYFASSRKLEFSGIAPLSTCIRVRGFIYSLDYFCSHTYWFHFDNSRRLQVFWVPQWFKDYGRKIVPSQFIYLPIIFSLLNVKLKQISIVLNYQKMRWKSVLMLLW